ncbi:MAG: hypothetical protein R3186_01085 [Ruegeria sp.]|nr:hypothetical protein [Ruegeria sp.]
MESVADVFLDANILKFSAVKKHVFRPRKDTINWGDEEHEVKLHEPYTINELHKIKNEAQRRDAVLLGMLAYAGISGRLKFHIHREVDLETWGLPGMTSPSGRFFNCPIHKVANPMPPQSRMIIGGTKTFKEHKLDFLSDIRHQRFVELTKMTGAYQGSDRPLNLNQALDAYHIWCAECADMKYFLTMDYKLQKVLGRSKIKTRVAVRTPDQLFREVLPKFGLIGAIKFLWQGYRFAKPRVGFDEGKGWT